MKYKVQIRGQRRGGIRGDLRRIMKCLCSTEQLRAADEMISSSESLATKDYALNGLSSKSGAANLNLDAANIEEAEISLRERGSLNYEEARALLGRIEYQKGNFEAALQVFEGIDITAITPKIKLTLSRKGEGHRRRSQNHAMPLMSIHAVSLLLEAIFLKAKSLQGLGRFKEAAQSCKVVLDIVESSLPEGLPEDFGVDYKLRETLSKAVELLPELWKLADDPREAIVSYRRALLHNWNLDGVTTSKIQKEFAIFLLYNGGEANPPNLRFQMDSSFVPKNNIEEAILLLMILVRRISLKKIEWDQSILDHLSYALSISGDLRTLAIQVEGLVPEILDERERHLLLALCYYGANDGLAALNLLGKLFRNRENPNSVEALLMASKICGEIPYHVQEGIGYARRALESLTGRCSQMESTAHYLLGVSLSAYSKSAISDSERFKWQSEALQVLTFAERVLKMWDPKILYHLSVENAELRKLDAALYYAKLLVKVEAGSSVKGWLLLARVLSAQKRFVDAESIVDAALDQTGKWEQGSLLRTKAKLQIAQGRLESATKTYTQLIADLQVQSKSFGYGKKHQQESINRARNLELETWYDLAYLYISLLRWHDAEGCLSKSSRISLYSAPRCHATGSIYEAKGRYKEALISYRNALDIDPDHVPSLISTAAVLGKLGNQSNGIARSLLMNALRIDRMNHSTWYNLGLLCKEEGTTTSLVEAGNCFEAAILLEESAPVEPFR